MIEFYQTISISHKYLNTSELSNFVVRHDNEDQLVEQLDQLKSLTHQDEILYLATCNRVLIVLYGHETLSESQAIDLLAHINPSLSRSEHMNLKRVIQLKSGLSAINHIMEVTASIDSLVVGEREILRQFRQAYKFCADRGLCGDNMRILEKYAVKAAKDIFTKTQIGARPVSVASLAIQEFLNHDLDRESRILLIGAGETNTKVARFLKKHGYNKIVIFNRSLDNARSLSDELNAEAYYLTELENYTDPFSAIVACTAAQEPIITDALWQKLNFERNSKIIVDLSIPNNVSRQVAQAENVNYISIGTIQKLADKNLKFRNSNIAAARILIRPHVDDFAHLYERRKVERAFSQLPEEIHAVKERALHKVYKNQIDAMPEEAQLLISEICAYMEKKCVAVPMKLAKSVV